MDTTSSSRVIELSEATFGEAVGSPGLAVVDFWAPWCGPCHAMAPQFERAAAMRPQYRFAKVNVDEEPALASAFQVRGIPTIAVLRDGEIVGTAAGVVGAEQLIAALDEIASTSPEESTAGSP
jgi:thioredoxin